MNKILETRKKKGYVVDRESFINVCSAKYKNKYDYSEVIDFTSSHDIVQIICHEKDEFDEEHGIFPCRVGHHVSGHACPKCANNVKLNKKEFIRRYEHKFGKGLVDFTLFEYNGTHEPTYATCNKHNVTFKTTPKSLYNGNFPCPKCQESSLEKQVSNCLTNLGIEFEQYKKFSWLGKQSLDFYLPKYNIAIECQGIQHFEPTDFSGKGEEYAIERLKYVQELDKNKFNKCVNNKVKLLYINYNTENNIIINEIKNIIDNHE